MGLSAWLLVAVIFILAGLVIYMYRELIKFEANMNHLGSTVAFNIADKNKKQRGFDQDIQDIKTDVNMKNAKLVGDMAALRMGLDAAHNKATTADFMAHSVRQELARLASLRIVHVHKHVISRKKKKKGASEKPMSEAEQKVLNRISLQMNELNQ